MPTINLRAHGKARADSLTGIRGLGWDRRCLKWRARRRVQGHQRHLGLYSNPFDAVAAYVAAGAGEAR
jgi:hypothetical protein